MSDSSSVKNLAITDNKAQKHGGCVGIFFQLIDWKKRLVKKKLFSKKLLTPARAKKFRGDEKMPNSKLHLIANENSGGFPSSKKSGNHGVDVDQKSEMRVPSLVARLMGLDSIPAARRDNKLKKALYPNDRQGTKDLEMEMGIVKHDSRPQKLQKTGVCERRAVTRFGAEALHIRSVLSRAKKYNHHHHHPKLVSPLKSPRIASGKSASRSSRLIGAAAKILEPGLQASRAKGSSLTYHAAACPIKTNIVTDGVGSKSAAMQDQPCYVSGTAKPLIGHTSCKNCGNLLDVIDCKAEVREQLHPDVPPPIVSDVISPYKKGKSFTPSHGQGRDIVLLRSQEMLSSSFTDEEEKSYAQRSRNEPTTRRMLMPRDSPAKWSSSCQPLRAREDDTSAFDCKHKTQIQEPKLSSESSSSGSTVCSMQVKKVSPSASTASGTNKNFVALNRSASGRTRMRSPTKVDSSKFDLEKKPCNRQHESLSHVRTLERKRRTINVSQLEGTTPANSIGFKQRNLRRDAIGGKRRDFDSYSLDNSNVKNKGDGPGEPVKVSENRNNDAVSFTFSSPLKQKMEIPAVEEETSTNNERKTHFQRPSPLKVDGLGAFLEQKLKELTSQENELASTSAVPQKSSTVILQELIYALSSEHLICHDDHMHTEDAGFIRGTKQERLLGTSCNSNHLSPGSVLEASFSSSSLDESLGHSFHPQIEQSEHDDELLDSAESFNKGSIGKIITNIVNQIPMALQYLYSFGTQFTRSNFNNMKHVLLNAELVLGISNDYSEEELPQLLIYRFLLNELDTMADDAMWTDFNGLAGFEDSKPRKMLKGFVFDCVMEYLESNCFQYFYTGFKVWTKLPLCIKAEMLAQEVKREVKKWSCMAGMAPDEIIEREMGRSLGKWTDFDIEGFETGVDIDGDILHNLVDEVFEDLVGCKHCSYSF
ncbi:uncharacterized protein [Cicer arietinum]|uniref:Uncharacterized protein LOC101513998 n=1 Tax=Cicer arietinum TaxID=3827 RepID=A0A1S2XRS8_CICAR|nr:uncharacterized protein LOC101513998 [Cicer arietinum]